MPSLSTIVLLLAGLAAPVRFAPHAAAHPIAISRDGQRDFDFEIGRWAIHVRRLAHPLSGDDTWTSPAGYTHIVRKVWDGRASLAELANDRPSLHYDGLMLRMYDPKTHQWNIYWGSSSAGTLESPLVGHFTNGRGEFTKQDVFDGRPIVVRVVYSDITPVSFRTEQDFSSDGGKSWQANLIQTFTRISARAES